MRPLTIMPLIRRFLRDRRGNVSIMFMLFLLPLVFCAGAAYDYTRAVQFRTALQGAVDAAALAGASEYASQEADGSTAVAVATNYMNSTIQNLPSGSSGSFTVTPGTTTSDGNNYATVGVSVTAQVPTTLMALVTPSMAVSVSATAEEDCNGSCGAAGSSSSSSWGGSGSSSSGSSSSGSSGSGSGSSGSSGSGSSGSGSSGSGSSGGYGGSSGSSGSGSSGGYGGSGSSGGYGGSGSSGGYGGGGSSGGYGGSGSSSGGGGGGSSGGGGGGSSAGGGGGSGSGGGSSSSGGSGSSGSGGSVTLSN